MVPLLGERIWSKDLSSQVVARACHKDLDSGQESNRGPPRFGLHLGEAVHVTTHSSFNTAPKDVRPSSFDGPGREEADGVKKMQKTKN